MGLTQRRSEEGIHCLGGLPAHPVHQAPQHRGLRWCRRTDWGGGASTTAGKQRRENGVEERRRLWMKPHRHAVTLGLRPEMMDSGVGSESAAPSWAPKLASCRSGVVMTRAAPVPDDDSVRAFSEPELPDRIGQIRNQRDDASVRVVHERRGCRACRARPARPDHCRRAVPDPLGPPGRHRRDPRQRPRWSRRRIRSPRQRVRSPTARTRGVRLRHPRYGLRRSCCR